MFGSKKAASVRQQSVQGVHYTFNEATTTLVVSGCDQESDVLSVPLQLAERCAGATVVDVSGNKLVSLENFECFTRCETLMLDGNELTEHSLTFGATLSRVHTLFLNKNCVKDAKQLAINAANAFPRLKYLSVLWNPCCPINEGPEYEAQRLMLLYKLPGLRFLDAKAVTTGERMRAEVTAGGTITLQVSVGPEDEAGEDAKDEPLVEVPKLKKDAVQAQIVKQAKKDVMNRTKSTTSIRKAAGLADSAPGLVRSTSTRVASALIEPPKRESSGNSGGEARSSNSANDDDGDDDDDSCLVGASDDTSQGEELQSGGEGISERRSKNLPMMRSVSLSGRNLESHFQYAKKGPQGKLVDREGYLYIRMRKTRWKRCWFVLKGGALFRYRTPTDELFVEQIIINGAIVAASANRRGNCFKIEKGGEKLVFQADDEWDQTSWVIELQKWTGSSASPAPLAAKAGSKSASREGSDSEGAEKGADKKKRWSLRGVIGK